MRTLYRLFWVYPDGTSKHEAALTHKYGPQTLERIWEELTTLKGFFATSPTDYDWRLEQA